MILNSNFPLPRRVLVGLLLCLLTLPLASRNAAASQLNLSAYRGKVVMLDFWASWCNPCRQSFPWMDSLSESYAQKGLVVVAVNVDHDRKLAADFLRDNPAGFKILYDPQGRIASKFHLEDMPTTYLIDRQGHVRFVHRGFFPDQEGKYLSQIRTLLHEPTGH